MLRGLRAQDLTVEVCVRHRPLAEFEAAKATAKFEIVGAQFQRPAPAVPAAAAPTAAPAAPAGVASTTATAGAVDVSLDDDVVSEVPLAGSTVAVAPSKKRSREEETEAVAGGDDDDDDCCIVEEGAPQKRANVI